MIQDFKTKIGTSMIKCQISRQLVPSFFCPLPNLNGISFPNTSSISDIRKVDAGQALEECNTYCQSSPGDWPVVSEKMIPTTDVSFNNPFPATIFPNLDANISKFSIAGNNIMPMEYFKMSFSIPKPDNNMTDDEWNQKIINDKPILMMSIWYNTVVGYQDFNKTIPIISQTPFVIQKPIFINGSKTDYTLMFGKVSSVVNFQLYPVTFQYVKTVKEWQDLNVSINVDNFSTKYTSTDFYYCPVLQMVPNVGACNDQSKVKLMNLTGTLSANTMAQINGPYTNPGQDLYICADSQHKIGPDPVWGAFYSEESAQKECIIRTQCLASYIHTATDASTSTTYFKTKIDCVDDPNNVNCSQALCETLFQSKTDFPVNEYQENVSGVNKIVDIYSIKNGVRTDISRPKIDFNENFVSGIDYNSTFQGEERDSAYLYMLNNLRYNRSKYTIGEESPFSMAYILNTLNGVNGISAVIKPKSFDYDKNSDLYLYSVVKVDTNFKPLAGVWTVNGNNVGSTYDANSTNTYVKRIKDSTYLIKSTDSWDAFRRIQNKQFLISSMKYETVTSSSGMSSISSDRVDNWVTIPPYIVDNFEKINNSIWTAYDSSALAPYFATSRFPSTQNTFNFDLTNNISDLCNNTNGVIFGKQLLTNYNTSFIRDYSTKRNIDLSTISPFALIGDANFAQVSAVADYSVYLVYSDHKLSYLDLTKEIEGDNYKTDPDIVTNNKWGLYNAMSPQAFAANDIVYDGEINNGINMLKKGTPNNTTIGIDWTPTNSEKGLKVFKFSFLFDDPEYKMFNISQ